MPWEIKILVLKIKIRSWTGIQTWNLQISILALYHLSYPGSVDGTDLNFSPESNAMILFVITCQFDVIESDYIWNTRVTLHVWTVIQFYFVMDV